MGKSNLWRGLSAVFLSSSVALNAATSIADTWRSSIDFALGTSSTVTTKDDVFTADYSTTGDLIAAHKDLGERVSEEGSVLLKNENSTLPLKDTKVTLFGMGSMYPFLGGVMGSSVTGEDQVNLVAALQDRGFEVNPTMVDIYSTLGTIQTGEKQTWTGTAPIFGLRPAEFAAPYAPSEPALDVYSASKEEGGAAAEANYQDSFKDYNDAAIIVISRPGSEGNDYYPGAEGIDEPTFGTDSPLKLVENEKALIKLAKENFDKVIVLINAGNVMEIEELKDDKEIDAMMVIGFPGAYGMYGVADILNGTTSPSGHLADTYAVENALSPAAQNFGRIELADLSAITAPDSLMPGLAPTSPLGSFGGDPSMSANFYLVEAEGIYTGYKYYETRYFDSILGQGNADSTTGAIEGAAKWEYENEVSYPFGYGLSYTTFEQKLDEVKVNLDDQTVTATVTVTNTGDVAGKDVAQLYYSAPYTEYNIENKIEKSAIEFLAMEKTGVIEPGASETVTITADAKYMTTWDSNAKDGKGGYILDGGDYHFSIGSDAHDAVNNVLKAQGESVDGEEALVKTEAIGKEGEVDAETFAKSVNGTEVVNQLADADVNYYKEGYATYLSRADWDGTFPRKYDDLVIDGPLSEEWVQKLSNELYQFDNKGNVSAEGIDSGLVLSDLAGAEITDERFDKLVAQIPLDTLIAKITKGGSVSDVIPEILSPLVYQNDGPNGFGNVISSRGEFAEDENAGYNMGTMANLVTLGNTFNKELVKEWGQLIGNDGLMTNNLLIWAVGANVHRSAYNGRNFEYYSEDDMISNYMAAATVAGALEKGVIVGPKHFAFNDQETQRSGISVYMTEQKAREGDLRAFQGAFEDAGALGAMASFSRIGATPVNGSVAVLDNILRKEWGFNGILSTDMNNNPGYFRAEMIIDAGVTMIADFSTDETMTQVNETWPYLTVDLVKKDENFVNKLRQNMKYQLYAFANSAAQNIKTTAVTPWWETALKGSIIGTGLLGLASAGMYVISLFKKNKEEVA